jgi:hypothetical protein
MTYSMTSLPCFHSLWWLWELSSSFSVGLSWYSCLHLHRFLHLACISPSCVATFTILSDSLNHHPLISCHKEGEMGRYHHQKRHSWQINGRVMEEVLLSTMLWESVDLIACCRFSSDCDLWMQRSNQDFSVAHTTWKCGRMH